jgi:hypothetical protein
MTTATRRGFDPAALAKLKARAEAFTGSQTQRSSNQPSIAEWYQPIRFLKHKPLKKGDAQRLREIRSAAPNHDDLAKLRRLALAYGADGIKLGWIQCEN